MSVEYKMGTSGLVLFLFPLTVYSSITNNTRSSYSSTWNLLIGKSSSQQMYPTTVGNLFVIPTVTVRTDPESFPVPPKKASNQEFDASKINMSASDTDKPNASVVSKNGDTVANIALNFDVNGNLTVLSISSPLHLNDTTTTNVRNLEIHDQFVYYISVRFGIFFGGIFLILLLGIGMYKARTRCRPEKYEDPLKI